MAWTRRTPTHIPPRGFCCSVALYFGASVALRRPVQNQVEEEKGGKVGSGGEEWKRVGTWRFFCAASPGEAGARKDEERRESQRKTKKDKERQRKTKKDRER